MIQSLSSRMVTFFVKNRAIQESDAEIYQYGVEITISSILNIGIILTMGILFHQLVFSLVYLLCFIVLRSYCGGYHAKTYFKCNVVFGIVFALTLIAFFVLVDFPIFIIAGATNLISILILCLFAPVVNENKPLTEQEQKRAKRISIFIGCILSGGSLLLIAFEQQIGFYFSIVLFVVSMLILIELKKEK